MVLKMRIIKIYWEPYPTFESFVLSGGLEIAINKKIDHFIPQDKYLTSGDDKILVDFVGKFENLDSDIKNLNKKLDSSIEKLPLVNKTLYDKMNIDINLEYSPLMREKVYHIYNKDFQLFNYEFDSIKPLKENCLVEKTYNFLNSSKP